MTEQEFKVIKYIVDNNTKIKTVMQPDKTFAEEPILDNGSIIKTLQKISELLVNDKK